MGVKKTDLTAFGPFRTFIPMHPLGKLHGLIVQVFCYQPIFMLWYIIFQQLVCYDDICAVKSKLRVKALDHQREHDGKILLFTDSFFAKSNEDTKYVHSSILFNDLLEVPVIDVKSCSLLQTAFNENRGRVNTWQW